MSVASHLGIDVREYDARIRTFIPDYEEMLDAAAGVVPASTRSIVDLGTGTGALAARCLSRAPRAHVYGIDMDPGILDIAARRMNRRAGARFSAERGSFLRTPLPRADLVAASFALHHVRTRTAEAALYRRIARAIGRRGQFVTVDCHPAVNRELARGQRHAWLAHLRKSYKEPQASGFLRAWAKEDVYVPLDAEIELMRRGGLRPEVIWRKGGFAVLRAIST